MNSILATTGYSFLGLLLLLVTISCLAGFVYGFLFFCDIIACICGKIYARCVYSFVVKRWPGISYAEEGEGEGEGEEEEGEDEGKQYSEASSCAICLENFNNGELCRILPACSHLFHILCVDAWLKEKPTCPICRTPVTKKAPQVIDEIA